MLRTFFARKAAVLLPAIFIALHIWSSANAAEASKNSGLALTITSDASKATDTLAASGVALHVQSAESPTPFLPAGKFTAVWSGFINAELRGNFSFQADVSGELKVEINGATALESGPTNGTTILSKAVQLNKGPNPFKATFTSPGAGEAWVRLSWTEKPPFTTPIPPTAFTHDATPELQKSAQLRLGRELFLNHRCAQCHVDAKLAGVPELKMDAPAFEGIGARRNYGWMARWILDPKAVRPAAQMPRVLHGEKAKEEAEAIAAYLASLTTGGEVKLTDAPYKTRQNELPPGEGHAPSEPKTLYERLHCAGCHNPPNATEIDPAKLSQKAIADKFPAGKLAEFLQTPEAHYQWTRMPNFHLSGKEAKELEDWLFSVAPKPTLVSAPTDSAVIERGKKLVQSRGCLNCHSAKLENEFKAPAMQALNLRHFAKRSTVPAGDCLGKAPVADYQFSAEQKSALDAFTLAGFASLSRHVPSEFAARETKSLNCTACHGQIDLIPSLDILGGKLKPDWAAKFIGGEIRHKLRYDAHPKGEPWVEARMPAFKTRAPHLAAGLAQQHGYAPKNIPETPVDSSLATVGHKLIGKEGGFSCVSCHGVGPLLALEVFESEGINLAYSADRLLTDYYRRWFRAPTSIDPQTKMPVYFDEGKSPLTDVLDGDGEKQITAVWEYLKLREKMPPPKVGEQ